MKPEVLCEGRMKLQNVSWPACSLVGPATVGCRRSLDVDRVSAKKGGGFRP